MTIKSAKSWRPMHFFRLIPQIKSIEKRNLVRGLGSKQNILTQEIEEVRRNCTPFDSVVLGSLLKGPGGLLDHTETRKKSSKDLFTLTKISPIEWENELCYTIGYINSNRATAIELVLEIGKLANLENLPPVSALEIMLRVCKNHGASNYISLKLAYLRSSKDLSATELATITEIENEIRHKDNVGLHFSALENISSKISLFTVAQRRVSGLVGRVNGDIRKAISLSNFIPTPLSYSDISGYLLRATESSLMDSIYAVNVLLNLRENYPEAHREIKLRLDHEVLLALENLRLAVAEYSDDGLVTEFFLAQNKDSEPSLNLYRVSAAFLERPSIAAYRNKLDRVVGVRLLAEIHQGKLAPTCFDFNDKAALLAKDGEPTPDEQTLKLDTFYRTYLFLKYISNRTNILALSRVEFQYIFENTMGLEMLLSEEEMTALYLTAPPEAKGLVAVLALALFRKKSVDPDVDFQFRADFISLVKEEHQGSILQFIQHLLGDSPQVANYIVGSLSEVTLEKMYTLVSNASQASQLRCDILKAVGQKLNRIEYFIEADSITTRAKVSKLQKYFDSSRMYVDSISMKKWLDSNPSVSTEQYRTIYPQIAAQIASVEAVDGAEKSVLIIRLNTQDEHLVSQIATDAFEQFCLNAEFGIQSYLGRRIRHNTLDGVTTETVDAVFRKPEYRVVISNSAMRRIVEAWMSSYKAIVDRLRRDNLQFKSSGSLFKASLDLSDPATQDNVRKLSSSLRSAGGSELLNDLVIAFCWRQVAPQLDHAARFIRTTVLREAKASIDKHFSGSYGIVEGQMKSDLHEAVNEVFKKVADWFQVPETGFTSASVRDLCQIILIDLNHQHSVEFLGSEIDTKYTGISVHRIYDCLAVLLQNAQTHGAEGSAISITATSNRRNPGLDLVAIDIASSTSAEDYERAKHRINRAIELEETSVDMVTEGYTGIKKAKFITKSSEGAHTMRYVSNDSAFELKIGFSIHAELANNEAEALEHA